MLSIKSKRKFLQFYLYKNHASTIFLWIFPNIKFYYLFKTTIAYSYTRRLISTRRKKRKKKREKKKKTKIRRSNHNTTNDARENSLSRVNSVTSYHIWRTRSRGRTWFQPRNIQPSSTHSSRRIVLSPACSTARKYIKSL